MFNPSDTEERQKYRAARLTELQAEMDAADKFDAIVSNIKARLEFEIDLDRLNVKVAMMSRRIADCAALDDMYVA